jgi:uncharacterized protein YbaR (Trm112 family)
MPRLTTPTQRTYRDRVKCPITKKSFTLVRRTSSAGKEITTYCRLCKSMHRVIAGPIKARRWK